MSQKFAHVDKDGFVIAFYASDIHSPEQIPAGSVEISAESHADLLAGQCAGKRMKVDASGSPSLAERAVPTIEELAMVLRANCRAALSRTDWLVTRHHEEALAWGSGVTLTADQFKALAVYRKALRDLPAAKGFPNVALPAAPDFIGAK